jgi:inosine/xanthosine triphosphate pyrophosphatase family protein
MTKPQIKEFNCETGEETLRDATAEEIEQMKKDSEEVARAKAEADAKAAEKQAIADRLGLSLDELKLLLG